MEIKKRQLLASQSGRSVDRTGDCIGLQHTLVLRLLQSTGPVKLRLIRDLALLVDVLAFCAPKPVAEANANLPEGFHHLPCGILTSPSALGSPTVSRRVHHCIDSLSHHQDDENHRLAPDQQ